MSEEQNIITGHDKFNRRVGELIFGSIDAINAQLPKGIAYKIPESFYDEVLKVEDDGELMELDINVLKQRYFVTLLRNELYQMAYEKTAKTISHIIYLVSIITIFITISIGFYLSNNKPVNETVKQQEETILDEQGQARSLIDRLLGKQQ